MKVIVLLKMYVLKLLKYKKNFRIKIGRYKYS